MTEDLGMGSLSDRLLLAARSGPGRPETGLVASLAFEYRCKPGNEMGGSLHIVLEDRNWERSHVTWCAGFASGAGDEDGRLLAGLLLRLPKKERKRAIDLQESQYIQSTS